MPYLQPTGGLDAPTAQLRIPDWGGWVPRQSVETYENPQVLVTSLLEAPDVIIYWHEVGAATTLTPSYHFELLEQLYTFRRPEEVHRFVRADAFLVALLLDAYFQIAKHFGPQPYVILEVITDPEAENYSELFAFIRTSLPPDQALHKLHRFDDEWWLDEAARAEGKLCIHVEFQ